MGTQRSRERSSSAAIESQRLQLISPPPEELLRLKWAASTPRNATKRKRAPPTPYEPPLDIFTPPREVFAPTRTAPKRKGSVARQVRPRTKGKDLRVNTIVQVKQELPDDLDLLAPMPPPSPTDDPLLLSGPPEREPKLEWWNGETSSHQDRVEDLATEDSLTQLDPPDVDVEPVTFEESGWSDNDDDGPYRGNESEEAEALVNEEEEEVQRLSMDPDDEETGGDMQSVEVSQDDDSSDTADEPSLVKIVSADPRAAARAVAILKQHDYDCYTKLTKKRRASHSAVVDLAKESRRKIVNSAGIVKTTTDRRRPRSTMGVIGDNVIIPGSPITTLPDLLQRAEEEIIQSSSRRSYSRSISRDPHAEEQIIQSSSRSYSRSMSRDPFETPVKFVDQERARIPPQYPAGPREWTKQDWKILDACFTDQRLDLASSHHILTPVDGVALQDVVIRFINLMGGQSLITTFGESWSRDNLLERTRVLQNKQRSGSVAPPTPSLSFASPLNPTWSNLERMSSLDCSLDFSETNIEQASRNPSPCSQDQDLCPPPRLESVPANNLGERFKGFFSSYIPTLSRQPPTWKTTRVQEQPCLPLPPPSVLKKARGPVATPARPLIPRGPHPKDLVHLNHVSLLSSNIPRVRPVPKRLVELVPVPRSAFRAETASRDGVVPRPRRSSGSVKDLVKGFEQMEKSTDRSSGIGGGITRSVRQSRPELRPKWKP